MAKIQIKNKKWNHIMVNCIHKYEIEQKEKYFNMDCKFIGVVLSVKFTEFIYII